MTKVFSVVWDYCAKSTKAYIGFVRKRRAILAFSSVFAQDPNFAFAFLLDSITFVDEQDFFSYLTFATP